MANNPSSSSEEIVVLVDPVKDLPFELASKIFGYLELEDVFKNCTRVCGTWNAFLSGIAFWSDVMQSEFGRHKDRQMFSKKKLTIHYKDVSAFGCGDISLEKFILKFAARNLSSCVMGPSAWYRYRYSRFMIVDLATLFELESPLPSTAVTDFRLYLDPKLLNAVYDRPKFRLAFLDKDREPLLSSIITIRTADGDERDGPVVRIEPGTHFIFVEPFGLIVGLHFLTPSQSRRRLRFLKLLRYFLQPQSGDAIRQILQQDPGLVNLTFSNFTPLMFAAAFEHKTAVQLLLEFKAPVNCHPQQKGVNGTSALNMAVFSGNLEIAKLLLENGADPNFGVGFAKPLFGAAFIYRGSALENQPNAVEIAKLLIEHGADVNAPVFRSETLLTLAAKRPNSDVLKFLLKHFQTDSPPNQ